MKTTLIIITLIVAATIIAVIFYQPANQVIRRTFEQLTGMQLVSSTTWENMQAENAVLSEQLSRQEEKTAGYQEANEMLMDSLAKTHQHIASLETDLDNMAEDLAGQQEAFDDMDEIQHVELFDSLTEGPLSELMEQGALVAHERIKDANWRLHERSYYKGRSETLTELAGAQFSYIETLHTINANLDAKVASVRNEKTILKRQYTNCMEAHDDIETEANRKAMAGYAVGLAGLLIGLFL